MEWITKLLGLAVGYYVFRGMMGKAKEGDMKIFLLLLAAFLATFAFRLSFRG